MQAAQIRWQTAQKKKLEEEKLKMQEVWTNFSQSAQQIYESGEMSEETERKLYALLFTLPPELQSSANNLLASVNRNDKAAAEKEFNNFKMVMEVFEATGGRVDDAALDSLINILSPENQEKIKAVAGAYKSVSEKGVTPYEFYGKSSSEVKTGIAESVAGQTPGLEGVQFKEQIPTTGAISYNEKRFNWKCEQVRLGNMTVNQLIESEGVRISPEKATGLEKQIQDIKAEGKRAGIDPAKINKAIQDKILGSSGGGTTITPTPTSVENIREDIKNALTLADAKRIEKNHIAKYGETTGIPNVDKFWSEERVNRLTFLKQGIDKLLDENKRLKKGTVTSAEVGFEIEDDIQKVEAVYQQLREEYMKYRKMLEKMGVDLSRFPELMSYDEYMESDIKPGMGIFYPSTWGKQKPSVY